MEQSKSLQSVRASANRLRSLWHILLLLPISAGLANCARANEPVVVLSSNTLKFEAQAQGTASTPQKILVANTGTGGMLISSITINGENAGDFVDTHACPAAPAVLAPNSNCEIQIVFKPRSSGDLTASLDISDNASGSPHSVSLGGHSGSPAPILTLTPAALAFGNQALNTSSKLQTIVITNAGSATLSINTGIAIAGAASSEFHLQKTTGACPEGSGQLAPGTSCAIGVVFVPLSAGPKSAQVIVVDDAAGSPQTVELSGVGSGT